MNKDRRKAIDAQIERLREAHEELARVLSTAQSAMDALTDLKDEEKEYFDNMPESLQGGDKGQAAEAAISELESAISELETMLELDPDIIETAIGHAEEAMNG